MFTRSSRSGSWEKSPNRDGRTFNLRAYHHREALRRRGHARPAVGPPAEPRVRARNGAQRLRQIPGPREGARALSPPGLPRYHAPPPRAPRHFATAKASISAPIRMLTKGEALLATRNASLLKTTGSVRPARQGWRAQDLIRCSGEPSTPRHPPP